MSTSNVTTRTRFTEKGTGCRATSAGAGGDPSIGRSVTRRTRAPQATGGVEFVSREMARRYRQLGDLWPPDE
ncbi:MAG TPA: hypothetical protein VH025_08805 [Solirubrobacteraceae bacterium]|jgi:hypothetical protein|nr:hypothetical protein [Solirubrobacteraceae bacterium]